METSYLKTLELDKIIARAAEGCVCKEAREKMLELEPQCDPDEVRYALEQTDAINTLLIKNGSPRFGGVEGVSQLTTRAVKGGVLSMGELLMVAGALRNFQNLSSWYGSSDHDALPTDDLFYALAPEPGLEQQISSAILAPDAMADTASRTLNELRKKIRATENSIRDRLESMVRNMDTSKYLQESVVSMRNGRYVVPVKSEYRGEVSGVIHDVSSTGATVFVEPQAVVEANARILQYRAQEAQEIERILVAFTAQVAAIEPQFQYSYQAMLDIDVLLAKARLALDMKAFKPAVRTDTSFSLVRARHPLIDPKKCVPVDIALGKEYDSLIITGPNTGGKTVTLKTAGLLCAMAQCGFLIPADERSEVCVFDEFLVDIGDEQSIEQSLSTFSGHMKKITGILELAMPHTLVLLDELGAGTDPAEGAALAVAIIEELRRRGVLLMATTHYAELKVFALETKGVVNASCEFDLETLRPTYKLSVGVPGKSNAFLISEKLGIPERVIEAAQQHLSAEDKRLDAVLGQLDDLKLQLKESQNEVEELKNEAAHQLDAARKKRDELIQQGENELEAARAKARRLAQDVESKAYALIDELRQSIEEAQRGQQAARSALEAARAVLSGSRSERAAQQEAAQTAAAAFQNARGDEGFDGEAAYRAALVEEREENAMAARLTQYGNALSAAEAALASLAAMWEGKQPVDGEALKARTEALSARAEALLRQEKEADARLSHNSRLLPQLEKAVREAGEKLEEFGVLDDLYRTASGNVRGARKIPLENYLLQYYFRRVIIATNARLSRMSEGRFSLCQKQEEGLGGKAGLALDVLDRHTGKVRDVGTLSGGESFLASLAMALGFADVVQARRGGVRLDTLFIDEGFGTLDEESLLRALHVLQELAGGQRLVGVISHVAALKDCIARKIEVRAAPAGGSTVHVACGD